MAKEITKAQREAVARYEAKTYDKTLIRLPKGQLNEIRTAAQTAGQSLNGYITIAIDNEMHGVHDAMNGTLKPASTANGIELDAAALAEAKTAAEAAGETVDVFLARAIHDTKQRDEITRQLKR